MPEGPGAEELEQLRRCRSISSLLMGANGRTLSLRSGEKETGGEEIGGGGGKKEERNKSAFSTGEVTNVPSVLAMEGEPYLRTPLNQLVRDHILVGSIS